MTAIEKPRVLVCVPRRPGLNPRICETADKLLDLLPDANPDLDLRVLTDNAPESKMPGDYTAWSKVTRVRNRMLDGMNFADWDYLLWIDSDVVGYPLNMPTILIQANPSGVSAPLVLIENSTRFYDVAAFVMAPDWPDIPRGKRSRGPRHLSHDPPYWSQEPNGRVVGMLCAGTVLCVPTAVYKVGARYTDHPTCTDHWNICQTR